MPIRESRGDAGTSRWPAVGALVAAGMLWGTSFLFGKWALPSAGPVQVTLWRFVLATLALLAVPRARQLRLPRPADVPLFLLTGALNVPATFLPQFAGLDRTSASVAALIIGSLPALVALASWVFFGERPGRVGWAAVLASSAGVALIVARAGAGNDWTGDALVFASMFAVVGWVLLGKRLMRDYPPLVATTWIVTFGTVVLVPISLLLDGVPDVDLPAGAWASIAVLGLGCTAAATALWNWGLRRLSTGDAGVFLNIEPLTGAVLGIAVLGEPLTVATVAGGVLILGAAVTISRRG